MNLGIDFGTSYTKLAYWENGQLFYLHDNHKIPSVATYVPALDELFFGSAAIHPADAESISALFFKLNLKRNPEFSLGKYTLGDLLFYFFTFLQSEYLRPRKLYPDSISLSVPNNFGLRARRALLVAAQNAFAVDNIALVPEPLAAIIGYNAAHLDNEARGDLLCIDIGGGTTDFSFIYLAPGQDRLLLESQFQIGHDAFSGSEIDRIILSRILAPAYQMQHSEPLPARILQEEFKTAGENFWFQKWIRHAEKIKIALSSQDALLVDIPDFYFDRSIHFKCTKDDFLQAVRPVNQRFTTYWEEAVAPRARSLGLTSGSNWSLDAIILLGGASQTRGMRDLIASLAPGVPILTSADPDFNVIRGLARWSGSSLSPGLKLKTIYPFRFYLEKKTSEENILEKIPFDTANLALDFQGRYEVCTIPLDSAYNLAQEEEEFNLRVFEIAEEDPDAGIDRFIDQDLVLELSASKNELDNPLTLCLNLASSRLELDNNWPGEDKSREDDLLAMVKIKQRNAFNLLSAFKFIDEGLLEEYYGQDNLTGLKDDLSRRDSSRSALAKILSILDLYSDK